MIFKLMSFIYLFVEYLSHFLFSEMEQVEQDPEFITLSRQFKATATELISVLEQVILHGISILSVIV